MIRFAHRNKIKYELITNKRSRLSEDTPWIMSIKSVLKLKTEQAGLPKVKE